MPKNVILIITDKDEALKVANEVKELSLNTSLGVRAALREVSNKYINKVGDKNGMQKENCS